MVEKILAVWVSKSRIHDVSLVPTVGLGRVVFVLGGSVPE